MSDRYHRQALLPEIGRDGQARLGASHAAVVGVGALGCTSADLLVRAGVGRVTLIDRDIVETTNLQRQTLYTQADADAGMPKAIAAAERLRAVNPEVEITPHVADANPGTIERLVGDADVLIDGTDNFETRLVLNDVACKRGVAYFYAGAVAGRGMMCPVLPGDERGVPCLRCLLSETPAPGSQPTCDTAGVFGPAVVIAAAAQAGEAIKWLAGRPDLVSPTLLEFDLLGTTRRRVSLAGQRDPDCPCCGPGVGRGRYDALEGSAAGATALCGSGAVQVLPPAGVAVDLETIAGRLAPLGTFNRTPFFVRGELRDPRQRLTVFADGRALFHGVAEPERARALYARFIGS